MSETKLILLIMLLLWETAICRVWVTPLAMAMKSSKGVQNDNIESLT